MPHNFAKRLWLPCICISFNSPSHCDLRLSHTVFASKCPLNVVFPFVAFAYNAGSSTAAKSLQLRHSLRSYSKLKESAASASLMYHTLPRMLSQISYCVISRIHFQSTAVSKFLIQCDAFAHYLLPAKRMPIKQDIHVKLPCVYSP